MLQALRFVSGAISDRRTNAPWGLDMVMLGCGSSANNIQASKTTRGS